MKYKKIFCYIMVTIFIATATFASDDNWKKQFMNLRSKCTQLLNASLKPDTKNRQDQIEQAFTLAKKMQTLAETNSSSNSPYTAYAANSLATVYFFKHDKDMYVENFERYLRIMRKGLRNKGVRLAEIIEKVASTYNIAGLTERAERLKNEAKRLRAATN